MAGRLNPMNNRMTVRLPEDLEDEVEAAIEAGVADHKSAFVRQAIRDQLALVEAADGGRDE